MNRIVVLVMVVFLAPSLYAAEKPVPGELAAPEKLLSGDEPINVEVGHATPYVIDWNDDGKKDLLVGQFGGGKLRVYLNKGEDAAPQFDGFAYVQAGDKDASVPTA